MGMLLGCGAGLWTWTDDQPVKADCPLARVDLLTTAGSMVDNVAHELLHGGCVRPCDRDIEALHSWHHHALMLSSDTDCLSLWDASGPVRALRVGVYPQDMTVKGDTALVCGGADGKVYVIRLPELHVLAAWSVPGMPERICALGDAAYLLTLLPTEPVQTALLRLNLRTGADQEIARLEGLPGAVCAASDGLWVAASETLVCFAPECARAGTIIRGFGLIRHLDVRARSILVTDPASGLCAVVKGSPRPGVSVLYRGDVGMAVFAAEDQVPMYTASTQPICSNADSPSVRPAK